MHFFAVQSSANTFSDPSQKTTTEAVKIAESLPDIIAKTAPTLGVEKIVKYTAQSLFDTMIITARTQAQIVCNDVGYNQILNTVFVSDMEITPHS